jgi:ATP-dependent Zn protease
MSRSSLRTVAPPPCLPLDIKDSLKEDAKVFLMGDFNWLPLQLMLAVCVSMSLRAKTLREIKENMGQSKSKARTLKNRKEDFRSKVLKIEKRSRVK